MENAAKALQAAGLKATRQREAILSIFLEKNQHLSAEGVFMQLKASGMDYSLATVYRTLSALVQAGLLIGTVLPDESGQSYCLAGTGHRHQLVCTGCKKVIQLEECPAQACICSLKEKYGFQITGHAFEIYGLCPECQKKGKGNV